MPRHVDHADRRREIAEAAVHVLAHKGLAGLTIRAVAEQLGGSVTLVTHYYRSREDLINDLALQLTDSWTDAVVELDSSAADPRGRLESLLLWALPETEEQMVIERARLQLLAAREEFPDAGSVFARWDGYMRSQFREHLRDLVEPDRVERTVDILRAVVTGITFEAYQHGWSMERQRTVLFEALAPTGLLDLPTPTKAELR